MELSTPFIKTNIETKITLTPDYFNVDLENNILQVLREEYEGKTFPKYGYINKIYNLEDYSGGITKNSSSIANVSFNVKFNCKISYPIINSYLVGTANNIRDPLIQVTVGDSIKVLVNKINHINKDQFTTKSEGVIYGLIDKNHYKKVVDGTQVVIRILDTKIIYGEKYILSIGQLERLATNEEYKRQVDSEFL